MLEYESEKQMVLKHVSLRINIEDLWSSQVRVWKLWRISKKFTIEDWNLYSAKLHDPFLDLFTVALKFVTFTRSQIFADFSPLNKENWHFESSKF